MSSSFSKRIAIIVGTLFILADVTLFAGEAFYKSILSSPDYLYNAHPNSTRITTGVLLEFVGYVGLIFIPVLLYPILKKHDPVLALGYVSFRLFEVVLLTIAQINKLALVGLSKSYLNATEADATHFRSIGDSIQSVIYWVNSDGFIYVTVFVIGTLMLNTVFYKSALVPKWISIWGLIGAVAIFFAFVLVALDLPVVLAIALIFPIAVQEVVMAIWLIVKGFNLKTMQVER